MEVRAQLTVVADGPVGAVGRQLDDQLGLPPGHIKSEWAVGSKMLIELPENTTLEPGTVVHTFGYPEPEIFGFFYVYADRLASAGIFIPSWFANPVRTSYRYLQHFLLHPYIWRYVEGGTLRSWGAKSIQESGRRGEPHLVGDGYARIGEGSGSTNVLTGSGVDEAWATGVQLAEAVIELAKAGKPYTKENLEATYVRRRRASWLERESRIAERARDGFHHGVVTGLIGMGLAGMTKGKLGLSPAVRPMPDVYEFFSDRIPAEEIARIRASCSEKGVPLHDALMDRAGWPAISYDGRLLISQQDALLVGGKVQAAPGYADHVVFLDEEVCRACGRQLCAEICSGEAIRPGSEGAPVFDREKCVHCGACFWNCPDGNLVFKAGAGGLHSAEN
jgi:electron-transferring-flavoprotein dehydrogenase